jgi:hypothetical protein
VIQKLYINIPLLDAIKVPTYARYLRDILKWPLPTTEVIKLTKECSVAILNISPIKKKDQDAPLLIAQLEINTSTMRCVTLEQLSVWCLRQSSTNFIIQDLSQHQCAYN